MSERLSIRRVLSETPLEKLHQRMLDEGISRRRKRIPWEEFRRSDYPKEALALAADQTKKLAEGEYGAVGLFGQVASGLALTKAPFDIISAAAMISGDEIRHADYCCRFAELCADGELSLDVDKDAVLEACRNLDRAEEVDFFLLKYSAIGEALAAALLTECRRKAADPAARALYTSLAADEVHHARLGWYYFAWRAPRWTLPEQQRLADRIAEFIVTLEREFWIGRDAGRSSADAARTLGVLDSERQREAIGRVMEEDILPGLDAIGLGGTHAWRVRLRGGAVSRRAAAPPSLVLPGMTARASFPVASSEPREPPATGSVDAAGQWLAAAVSPDGQVRFSVDPNGLHPVEHGPMHHGRAAVVLAALGQWGGAPEAADRVGRRLAAEIDRGLAGDGALPREPVFLAGTLALAHLAGIDLGEALVAAASRIEDFAGPAGPWHAAQVATALGPDTPPALWRVCVDDLDRSPWAPWTARAAERLGDVPTHRRAVRGLLVSLASLGEGGTSTEMPPPAIARIAATLEALDSEDSVEALARRAVARAYLERWQLVDPLPPGVEPAACRGAFVLTPLDWTLRTDVTAHALLALLPSRV